MGLSHPNSDGFGLLFDGEKINNHCNERIMMTKIFL
jgi:hypothetical protein